MRDTYLSLFRAKNVMLATMTLTAGGDDRYTRTR